MNERKNEETFRYKMGFINKASEKYKAIGEGLLKVIICA